MLKAKRPNKIWKRRETKVSDLTLLVAFSYMKVSHAVRIKKDTFTKRKRRVKKKVPDSDIV